MGSLKFFKMHLRVPSLLLAREVQARRATLLGSFVGVSLLCLVMAFFRARRYTSYVQIYVDGSQIVAPIVGAELGATHQDTDEETVNGGLAALSVARRLGPAGDLALTLRRDLSDQNLGTVQSLVTAGSGAQQEVPGSLQATSAALVYALQGIDTSLDIGIGAVDVDYQALTITNAAAEFTDDQGQIETCVFGGLSRGFGARWQVDLSARYERERFDDPDDETDALLASLGVLYRPSRSIELEAGFVHDRVEGRSTGLDHEFEDVGATENRAGPGLLGSITEKGPSTSAPAELDKSPEHRLLLWRAAGKMILEDPLLGKGFKGFQALEAWYTEQDVHESDPHSVYLYIASQMGLPALARYLMILG